MRRLTGEHLFTYDYDMSQNVYVNKIHSFYRANRRMPTYRELAKLFGYKSTNAASKLVNKLIDLGILLKDKTGKLLPANMLNEIPVLGLVEAGFPSPAEEELVDTMSFDEYLVRNKEATYILKVKGDSMIDAGIMPGDMVLVERGKTPHEGDVVIAEVDGEWTMKYFRKKGSVVALYPGNKKYKPIFAKDELNIAAVVVAVIRKYKRW